MIHNWCQKVIKKRADTTHIHIRLSNTMVEGIDIAVKLGLGSNRSDIIKTAIANYLQQLNIIEEIKKRKL